MVLGKLPSYSSSAGASYNLDNSSARAYCSRCGWGCLDVFSLIYPFSPLSSSLWETVGWMLFFFLVNGPLRQGYSLYQTVSHGERERKEK